MKVLHRDFSGRKSIVRKLLPYAGIPLFCCALLLIHAGSADAFTLLRLGILVIAGYAASISDLKTMRVPNSYPIAMLAAWIMLMTPKLFYDTDSAVRILTDSALGLALGGGLFILVYLISRKGLGGGDVKFMAIAAMYLGFSGSVSAILIGTVLAALVGLALITLKKIGRKDPIPLIPFLYIGILITIGGSAY